MYVKGFSRRRIFQVLVNLFSKPMELARYFCAGCASDEADFAHYALSVDL